MMYSTWLAGKVFLKSLSSTYSLTYRSTDPIAWVSGERHYDPGTSGFHLSVQQRRKQAGSCSRSLFSSFSLILSFSLPFSLFLFALPIQKQLSGMREIKNLAEPQARLTRLTSYKPQLSCRLTSLAKVDLGRELETLLIPYCHRSIARCTRRKDNYCIWNRKKRQFATFKFNNDCYVVSYLFSD